MARLWFQDDGRAWQPRVLDGVDVPLAAVEPSACASDARSILIRQTRMPGGGWVLLAGSLADVRANGEPVRLGIKVLRDRDEIRVAGGEVFFFSDEKLAEVAPFPGTSGDAVCPRCRRAIGLGDPAVACPHCGIWHHQDEAYPCWTVSPECISCGRPAGLDPDALWAPEEGI
jgi:hypothetical protein